MDEDLENMSFDELCGKIEGFEETYEKVCATGYSFMNKVDKWLHQKSEYYGKEIGFIVVPDLLAISFLFFENFVEMPIYLTEDEQIKLQIKDRLKRIRGIKETAIDDLSVLIFSSEKGFNLHQKYKDDEIYEQTFHEVKTEFHECVLDFYQQTKEVQDAQASMLMMGGLLSAVVESMAFSEPDLRDEAKEIILRIKNSWTEIFI